MSILSYLTHAEGQTDKIYLLRGKENIVNAALDRWVEKALQESKGEVLFDYGRLRATVERVHRDEWMKPKAVPPFYHHVCQTTFLFMIYNFCEAKARENPEALDQDAPEGVKDLVKAFGVSADGFREMTQNVDNSRNRIRQNVEERIRGIKEGKEARYCNSFPPWEERDMLKRLENIDYTEFGEGGVEHSGIWSLYSKHVRGPKNRDFVLTFPNPVLASYRQMPASFYGVPSPPQITGELVFRESADGCEELHLITRDRYNHDGKVETALRRAFSEHLESRETS